MQRGRPPALTSLFKPIATALWHCHVNNRAETARREPKFSGRQMEVGRITAGSSRALRLDPFSLPVRFEAADEAADGRRRIVDLHRERVVLRRSVRGMRMALNMPVATYRGVAIRLSGRPTGAPPAIAVVLEHGDPALSLPLFSSPEADDIVAEWQSWGRVLGLPLWSPKATAACANRSPGWARFASKRRPGAAAAAAPSRAAVRRGSCTAAPARCGCYRWCIATSARSSRGIKRSDPGQYRAATLGSVGLGA